MDDSYFEADLIKQFQQAETDYQVFTSTDTRERTRGHGNKAPGGETETILFDCTLLIFVNIGLIC